MAAFKRDDGRLSKSLMPNGGETGEPRSKQTGSRRTLLSYARRDVRLPLLGQAARKVLVDNTGKQCLTSYPFLSGPSLS